MKIAFCNRKNFDNPLGGDGIQMLKTKFFLEKNHGLNITVITDPKELNSKYDIIHIFNYLTIAETEKFFQKALSLKIPIISSSIYWDYRYSSTHLLSKISRIKNFIGENEMKRYTGITELISKFTGRPIGISNKFKKKCAFFIDNSNLILPNSHEEAEKLLEFSDRINCRDKIRVVYNATDFTTEEAEKIDKKAFFEKYGIPKNYILQVGRIEYLKNQLNLILAMSDNQQIPLVFVGKVVEPKYLKEIEQLAKKRTNVYFIPNVPHEEIKLFYKYCKAHVLLSLRESPGLVSLEALSLNKPIVVSDERFAPVRTYFDTEGVFIANPLDKKDIVEKVLLAYNYPPFKNKLNVFNWESVANDTYNAYLELRKNIE